MVCVDLGWADRNDLDHDHDHGHGGDDEHGHHHDHGTHQNGEHEDGHISSIHMKDEKHVSHKHNANASAGSKVSGRDLAMMGVLIHVMGDAGNNIGVIIAALVIWLTHYGGRYYADPAVSMGISLIIFASSIPLSNATRFILLIWILVADSFTVKRAGTILLQSAPEGVEIDDVTHDIEQIPGVLAVHELHIWRLDQKKSLASAHIVLSDKDYIDFKLLAKTINECFHAYGVHSVTLQPELVESGRSPASETLSNGTVRVTVGQPGNEDGNNVEAHKIKCQLFCGSLCADLSCCR
ncbi:unnamed protein product [Penicillium manginii]